MTKRVGFWLRALALLIDSAILFLLFLLFGIVLVLSQTGDRSSDLLGAIFIAVLLIYTAAEVVFAGTPGKRMLRLKIGCNNGIPADGWRLFLRWSTKHLPLMLIMMFLATNWAGFYLVGNLSYTFVFLGCLNAANDDKLSWHDQWAGTAVFRTRDLTGKIAR